MRKIVLQVSSHRKEKKIHTHQNDSERFTTTDNHDRIVQKYYSTVLHVLNKGVSSWFQWFVIFKYIQIIFSFGISKDGSMEKN